MADEAETWWLDSAEARHEVNPRSFFIPPVIDRQQLAVGRSAKLVFEFDERIVDGIRRTGERMWVEVVERREDGGYRRTLVNDPVVLHELAYGELVEFRPEHVAAIEYSDDELGYAAAEPAVNDESPGRNRGSHGG